MKEEAREYHLVMTPTLYNDVHKALTSRLHNLRWSASSGAHSPSNSAMFHKQAEKLDNLIHNLAAEHRRIADL